MIKWGVLFTVEHALPTKVYRWVKKNDEKQKLKFLEQNYKNIINLIFF